jgi:hypothetical protein
LLDLVHDRGQRARGDRPLLAGAVQPDDQLLTIERLATAVFLDDEVRNLLDALVRGESPAARQALAAAAVLFRRRAAEAARRHLQGSP